MAIAEEVQFVKSEIILQQFVVNALSQHKRSGGTIYDIIDGLARYNCHNINGPGIDGPAGPLMSSYLVRPDHLCTRTKY